MTRDLDEGSSEETPKRGSQSAEKWWSLRLHFLPSLFNYLPIYLADVFLLSLFSTTTTNGPPAMNFRTRRTLRVILRWHAFYHGEVTTGPGWNYKRQRHTNDASCRRKVFGHPACILFMFLYRTGGLRELRHSTLRIYHTHMIVNVNSFKILGTKFLIFLDFIFTFDELRFLSYFIVICG